MAPLRVLISGGGIAGPTLAFWLSKQGHSITIAERFSSLRATGQQIDVREPGTEVIKQMGIYEAFCSKIVNEPGVQLVDSSGKRRAYFPANKSGKGKQSLTTDSEIMRGDLCHILYDSTKSKVKYIFDTSVESFEEVDNVVNVEFSDGSKNQYDLLVGADGQGSRIRRMMRSPGSPDPFHSLKMYAAYFTLPWKDEDYSATGYLATGKRGIFTRRHNPHTIQVYLFYMGESDRLRDMPKSDIPEQKKVWASMFQDAGWNAERYVREMQDKSVDDFFTHPVGQVRMDSWSHGRVVLVGDAAYCPSVLTGMGTTAGIVGAYVLAGEIARAYGNGDSLSSALKSYDTQFQSFINPVQKQAGSFWIPTSSWGISVVNFLVGVVSSLRLDVLAPSGHDDKGWKLPDYAELGGKEE